jgi:hypothetical protein
MDTRDSCICHKRVTRNSKPRLIELTRFYKQTHVYTHMWMRMRKLDIQADASANAHAHKNRSTRVNDIKYAHYTPVQLYVGNVEVVNKSKYKKCVITSRTH